MLTHRVTTTGLKPDEFEVISEKVTYRLAQCPGSYVVTKFVRPVIKMRDSGKLVSMAAPRNVIDCSRADVSLQAGVLVDKFAYHQPLYRQHRELTDSGFKASRQWLTQLMKKTIDLLTPIYDAQFNSILLSRVKAMDETPIKAGVTSPGKMKAAYFWPIYGEQDEICFKFYQDRAGKNVEDALGLSPPSDGVLLTDGYTVYERLMGRLLSITPKVLQNNYETDNSVEFRFKYCVSLLNIDAIRTMLEEQWNTTSKTEQKISDTTPSGAGET